MGHKNIRDTYRDLSKVVKLVEVENHKRIGFCFGFHSRKRDGGVSVVVFC